MRLTLVWREIQSSDIVSFERRFSWGTMPVV